MLILAGVSLNATIGENGIITRAQQAKEKYNIASLLEELEVMMVDFNLEEDTEVDSLKKFMNEQVEKKKIDSFKTIVTGNRMQCIIEKDGYLFYAVPDNNKWKVVYGEEGLNFAGVELEVYTNKNASSDGKFNLGEDGKETDVVFYEKIEGELNFDIVGTVNIYLYNDMTLTNSGLQRSAIDIHENSTLNLYLEKNDNGEDIEVIVNSGYGETLAIASDKESFGGMGGYAGIHVPKTATLNLYGSGKLVAYGGRAGDGAGTLGSAIGGRRPVVVLEQVLEEIGGKRG